MAHPVLLAIETSQRAGGIALRQPDGTVRCERFSPRVRHDEVLMPAVDHLFRRAGLKPRDLQAVAVSIGPGGFTGLRIAVSTAQMLALTTAAAVVAVPSALVAATGCDDPVAEHGPILVALATKGQSCWATRLQCRDRQWRIINQPGLVHAEDLPLDRLTALLGDEFIPDRLRRRCADRQPDPLPVIEPRFDPAACLLAASEMLAQNQTTEAPRLRPLYAREPEAVRLWAARKTPDPSAGPPPGRSQDRPVQ